MKTITIQLQEDKDAQLLMDMLRSVKFEGEIEAFEELETISEEELQMLSDRVEEYRKDPSKGKDLKDMELILSKYVI